SHSLRSLLQLLSFSLIPRQPRSTLFPYTTLFRSQVINYRSWTKSSTPRVSTVWRILVGATVGNQKVNSRLMHIGGYSGDLRDSVDRKSTRLNSSHDQISYAVFCLKKKNNKKKMNM